MKKTLLLIILVLGIFQLPCVDAQQLKAISFNIHSNSTPKEDGKNAWHLRRNAVVNMINSEEPAIIGMQEALLDQLTYIDKTFRNKYRRVGAGRDNGITRGEHTAIYYDRDILELVGQSKTRWLSLTPQIVSKGWDSKVPRIITIAHFRVKATGNEFFYFNTHLETEGTVAHREEIKLIAKMIQELVPSNMPVILGGDMNSSIYNEEFQPLYDIDMEPARRIATRTDYRNTFNDFGNSDGAMNDHFIVRDIHVLRFKTLIKNFGASYISNHFPVEIIFTL